MTSVEAKEFDEEDVLTEDVAPPSRIGVAQWSFRSTVSKWEYWRLPLVETLKRSVYEACAVEQKKSSDSESLLQFRDSTPSTAPTMIHYKGDFNSLAFCDECLIAFDNKSQGILAVIGCTIDAQKNLGATTTTNMDNISVLVVLGISPAILEEGFTILNASPLSENYGFPEHDKESSFKEDRTITLISNKKPGRTVKKSMSAAVRKTAKAVTKAASKVVSGTNQNGDAPKGTQHRQEQELEELSLIAGDTPVKDALDDELAMPPEHKALLDKLQKILDTPPDVEKYKNSFKFIPLNETQLMSGVVLPSRFHPWEHKYRVLKKEEVKLIRDNAAGVSKSQRAMLRGTHREASDELEYVTVLGSNIPDSLIREHSPYLCNFAQATEMSNVSKWLTLALLKLENGDFALLGLISVQKQEFDPLTGDPVISPEMKIIKVAKKESNKKKKDKPSDQKNITDEAKIESSRAVDEEQGKADEAEDEDFKMGAKHDGTRVSDFMVTRMQGFLRQYSEACIRQLFVASCLASASLTNLSERVIMFTTDTTTEYVRKNFKLTSLDRIEPNLFLFDLEQHGINGSPELVFNANLLPTTIHTVKKKKKSGTKKKATGDEESGTTPRASAVGENPPNFKCVIL